MSKAERQRRTWQLKQLEILFDPPNLSELHKRIREDRTLLQLTDELGDTLLCKAVAAGRCDVASMLISLGADINARCCGGFTCLQSALPHLPEGDLTMFQFLLEKGAYLETPGVQTWTALHAAAAYGNIQAIHMLLRRGANIEARESIDNGWTPLMCAAFAGATEAVSVLLNYGASATEQDWSGRTAEDLANQQGHQETVAAFHPNAWRDQRYGRKRR